jgi:hypothetical protein
MSHKSFPLFSLPPTQSLKMQREIDRGDVNNDELEQIAPPEPLPAKHEVKMSPIHQH